MWSHFKTDRYYGVEILKGKGKNLNADYRRVIDSIDLSDFNVIDCDSYGIPFDVMLKIFNNKTLKKGTVIIYAAISNRLSGVSKKCLKMFGLENMYKRSQVLIAAKAIDLFYAMLERQGVKVICYYKVEGNFTKHYGYFIVDQGAMPCRSSTSPAAKHESTALLRATCTYPARICVSTAMPLM